MPSYTIYIIPQAWHEIKDLPGNMRQRIKRIINNLADNPRPSRSKALDTSELPGITAELRRLRIEKWRIVYAITEADSIIDILTIRKRPPYDYGDLEELIGGFL